MKDRNVLRPDYYMMEKVAGTENIVKLTPAPGEVYEEGTLINKATLWKDATAALFGLGVDSVPDDGFAYLGKYAQHWWRRRSVGFHGELDPISKNVYVIQFGNRNINYADSYSVDKDTGALSLNSPSSFEINWENGVNLLLQRKPCYIKNLEENPDKIFYIPEEADFNSFASPASYQLALNYQAEETKRAAELVSVKGSGPWEYVQSSDRSAYPDSGEQGGYEYEYLGIPFDNAVGAPGIESGSYTGTGTYNSGNKNSLSFGFKPRLLIITNREFVAAAVIRVLLPGSVSNIQYNGTDKSEVIYTSVNGNTVEWYNPTSAMQQLNQSGVVYDYVAIG